MFTFGYLFSRMSWSNICFHRYFSQYLSLYEVFNVQSRLNFYQSSEASILWILWSLVKPVLSKTALPCWSRLALACPFYIRSSACIAMIFLLIWQPPAFPYRHQYSIIGRFRLNHRVRDVDGCFPKAHRHQKIASRTLVLHALEVASQLPLYRSLSTSCYQVFSW